MSEKNELMIQELREIFDPEVKATSEVIEYRISRILQLESALGEHPDSIGMEQYNPGNIQHHFGTGIYGRELFLGEGTVVVSKIHRNKTLNIIAQGLVEVLDPYNGRRIIKGPYVFVSEPMTKRVVIAHENTVWVTGHENADNSENLDEIEFKTIAKDFNDKLLKEK